MTAARGGNFPGASSGNILVSEPEKFPELYEAVARAIALPPEAPLPASLRGAIARFPERVLKAIDYLNYQRQRQHIRNPARYLYEAIVENWDLSTAGPRASILPAGFRQWFDKARREGQVIAATVIDGIHHTLHVEKGWVPTEHLV